MKNEELDAIRDVLDGIPNSDWQAYLEHTGSGMEISALLDGAGQARRMAKRRVGKQRRPGTGIVAALGSRLLDDLEIRRMIVSAMSEQKWWKLRKQFRALFPRKLAENAAKTDQAVAVVVDPWRRGTRWARDFCEIAGLPNVLALGNTDRAEAVEKVQAVKPLEPLHDFQEEVYRRLRQEILPLRGSAGLLSLPTGAGKTRVVVEAVVDHVAARNGIEDGRNIVLWIAQTSELLMQAWEAFREEWQVDPKRRPGREPLPRNGLLFLQRAWASRAFEELQASLGPEPTVVFCGSQQLASWAGKYDLGDVFPAERLMCVVVDEAHRVVTPTSGSVLVSLGIKRRNRWQRTDEHPPFVGITATPWRTIEKEAAQLGAFFDNYLIAPGSLRGKPVATLTERQLLSAAIHEKLDTQVPAPKLTAKEKEALKQYRDLPQTFLRRLGQQPERNARILERLLELHGKSVLVFGCDVDHARLLAVALREERRRAEVIHAGTPRAERLAIIDRFKKKEIEFLCNVNVLTTGFDAPKVDVVCLTQPTMSALRYEQMAGRGLRGPKNGGTLRCLIIDVQSKGLPKEVLSYERVIALWDEAPTPRATGGGAGLRGIRRAGSGRAEA